MMLNSFATRPPLFTDLLVIVVRESGRKRLVHDQFVIATCHGARTCRKTPDVGHRPGLRGSPGTPASPVDSPIPGDAGCRSTRHACCELARARQRVEPPAWSMRRKVH